MKSMGDPHYVYRPWTEEQRQAARERAAIRIYGSVRRAEAARKQKLRNLIRKRDRLQRHLNVVKASINHYRRYER